MNIEALSVLQLYEEEVGVLTLREKQHCSFLCTRIIAAVRCLSSYSMVERNLIKIPASQWLPVTGTAVTASRPVTPEINKIRNRWASVARVFSVL